MRKLLVIEDGAEYANFARLYLGGDFDVRSAGSAREALESLRAERMDALLFDLRFDRADPATLVGDLDATAKRLFGGDGERALRYLQDEQGTLILAEIRKAGFTVPAVFVHDFSARRLGNLRALYGAVSAVASFDAAAIREKLLTP